MVSIKEMRSWDYETTWRFFRTNALEKEIPEAKEFILDMQYCETVDMRGIRFSPHALKCFIDEASLILIDGTSTAGKGILANNISNAHGIKTIDIDTLCIEWLHEQERKLSPVDFTTKMLNFDQETDEYIVKNLEQIIVNASKNGTSSVVLVGVFIQLMYRTIIANKIGRHFKKVVSFMLHEPLSAILARLKQVKQHFNEKEMQSLEEKVLREFTYLDEMCAKENRAMLGIGMDASFIADGETVDIF